MSNYEFWDELGKIFSAVVAYQEKNIEFNKRFIVPWIRLGNVFDKQDKNDAAISAYQQAIDIDPANAQNWFELGNIHFKSQNHADAIHAFNRAIELDPGFGWSYNNLALTLVAQGQHEQAIPLYRKSIELLSDTKDKAVAWNRLGNVHRKLNEYEQALEAFHQADELDKDNAGFRDDMDEVAEGPTVVQSVPGGAPATKLNFSPIELIIAQSRAEEAASHAAGSVATPTAVVEDSKAEQQRAVQADTQLADLEESAPTGADETVTVVVPDTVETFTESLPTVDAATDTSEPALASAEQDETPGDELDTDLDLAASPSETAEAVQAAAPEMETLQALGSSVGTAETQRMKAIDSALEADTAMPDGEVTDDGEHNAYEEYLKDSDEPMHLYAPVTKDEPEDVPAPQPVAQVDATGELQIEMDTKNAHVWNELGNVYFNTSAFDDAIVAYSKAIELDRWFAWPYSNLALAYVQKRRFVEAILLYQRSIELFTSDKDKAISWNRLGNVYRRLNDYENAIAAYQRADALDPDNATLSLQSRFSLLGNYAMDQKASYAS
jgi:tetratricopeptide (TPR) repeat protein